MTSIQYGKHHKRGVCQVLFSPGRGNDWVVWMSEKVFTEEDREMGNSLELYRKKLVQGVRDP